MNMEDMTVEEFIAMKKKFDEAENDTTPFAIVDDRDGDKLKVYGDPDKTEIVKQDYVVQFFYRNTEANKEAFKKAGKKIIGETPNYIAIEEEYKDAWIPPTRFTQVQSTFLQLYKFFNMVSEDGELRDMTNDEIVEALDTMSMEMVDAMCAVVCEVLGIPSDRASYVLPISAAECVGKMIVQFPEVVNGMDFTSDSSSEGN